MNDKLLYRIWEAGFEVSFNPPEADGNCFYRAAAFQVKIAWDTLKTRIFEHLEQNQFDVSLSESFL
jgi:hypothetical protein